MRLAAVLFVLIFPEAAMAVDAVARFGVIVTGSGGGIAISNRTLADGLRERGTNVLDDGALRAFLRFEHHDAATDDACRAAITQFDLDRMVVVEAAPASSSETVMKVRTFDKGDTTNRGFLSAPLGEETPAMLEWLSRQAAPATKSAITSTPDHEIPDIEAIGITPKDVHQPKPVYPNDQRYRNKTGTVILEITVNEGGRVIAAKILDGPDPFVAAALTAVREWRYEPVLVDGKPIVWRAKVNLKFRLN